MTSACCTFPDEPTESVCPVCLATIPAVRRAVGDAVHLVKTCRSHGTFSVPVWRGLASYVRWGEGARALARPPVCATPVDKGCPHDCGLCPDHRQQSCCVLLEVTSRCDLACPVCFASASRHGRDASLAEIDGWLDALAEATGARVHVQISGGEPTVRDDLPEIVRRVRARGFDFVQLNTNGVRLAQDPDYVDALAAAGLDCVFLQFDGVSDAVHRRIRGARLAALKELAVARCGNVGIGVVLVPTVVPGVNDREIGAIVDFAVARLPEVRAVHFQPISYFGRCPEPSAATRITLPEIVDRLVAHGCGTLRFDDFRPGSVENPYCSFSGRFRVDGSGRLRAERDAPRSCCGVAAEPGPPAGEAGSCCSPARPSADVARARRYVAGQWRAPERSDAAGLDAFDTVLAARSRTLGLSGMAFQDAWTLDLDRVRQCHIHVVAPDRRIVPFCAYNLTDLSGRSLYRPAAPARPARAAVVAARVLAGA
ncbi:radical SAM protein [Rhodoplanes sp. TEM]|uniref:Radical SAM protein n=1 Tax=Rhodoplanes tepidamans TaxID=200616 RepID=A0ABT5J856_RHOTP|nr:MULTISPECIES: radical SAM (seleno)protein TrsS [Rhodoplanes]MDC7785225.1 radical SAM protein [Rhodoplanes tepidamans]MDC7986423.1 radical SAM protein [Rhodoplanes sp. TEM]MDQ0353483.1 putative radical SAM superfamily Fe-S cluster-containing enzyme [Rhodoplanes tepidamans]